MIDKLCKRILGHPEILGRIIKGFIKEAKDVSLEEIIELIKEKKDREGNSYFQQLNNVIDIAHHGEWNSIISAVSICHKLMEQ